MRHVSGGGLVMRSYLRGGLVQTQRLKSHKIGNPDPRRCFVCIGEGLGAEDGFTLRASRVVQEASVVVDRRIDV